MHFPLKQLLFRDATASYKAEAAELQKRIQRLQSQLDVVSGQASALVQGRRTRSAAALSANEQLLLVEEKLSNRNLEVRACWRSRMGLMTISWLHYATASLCLKFWVYSLDCKFFFMFTYL